MIVILAWACTLTAISANAQDNVRLTVSATTVNSLAANGTPATGAPVVGMPVMDLTKPDFSVQDSGKARTIATFEAPNAKPAAPPALTANDFSNLPDFRETSGAIFVVLDTINTRYIDERDTRPLILKFLGKAAQAKHAVTLAILSDTGLHIVHDYRTGSDVLLAAMAKAGLGGMKGVAAPADVTDADVNADAARLTLFSKGEQSNPTPETKQLLSSVDMPLTMFQDIAFAAQGLPGRKSLVWVTNAVPFDIDPKTMQFKSPLEISHGVAVDGVAVGGSKDHFTDAEKKRLAPIWRRSMRALFDSGVAIYPVEVRGSYSAGSDAFTITRMKELALLTGGKSFYGSNDPFPEILATSGGNTAGYVLGFAAEANASPDFHRIEVIANRANIQISHPAGYFPAEGTPKSQASKEVGIAMSSPLEYTGIRFKIAVTGIEEGTAGKKKVNLVISLPGDSGVLDETAGTVDVGFLAKAFNASGQVVGTMNESAGGKFPPEAVAQIKEIGFQLKRSFEVSPGECTVRFLARDNQSGRMGDIIFPLNVK
jgi:VWFA-related protein